MNLSKALRVEKSQSVALVGAGGKTSALLQLARELSPCLVTTTTHLGAWQLATDSLTDKRIKAEADFSTDAVVQPKVSAVVWVEGESLPEVESTLGQGITVVTGPLDEATNRYKGLSFEQLNKLREMAGYHDLPLLIEADGSRQRPLKAPGAHEPALTDFVDTVVVVVGLSGLGQPLSEENVHRPKIFAQLSGLRAGGIVTADALVNVLSHPEGGLKNIPTKARRVVLLNQADTPELQAVASQMSKPLLAVFDGVSVAALQAPSTVNSQQSTIFASHEKTAGVILAAGESKRFGQPKQLLDFHGKPFIRVIAEKAIAAGLDPVVVVQGTVDLHAALAGLDLVIVQNDEWREGQASSIRAGIKTLPQIRRTDVEFGGGVQRTEGVGGTIFLLADQPQVTVEVMRAVVERHAQTLDPVIAPYVFDKRANPVLFDRVTFADLLKLTGDVGGRGIFSKFSPRYVNWYDQRLLLDVDTPKDYERLINGE